MKKRVLSLALTLVMVLAPTPVPSTTAVLPQHVLFSLNRTANTVADAGNRFDALSQVSADAHLTAWDNNRQVSIGSSGSDTRTPIVFNNGSLAGTAPDNGWKAASVFGVDNASAFELKFSTEFSSNIHFSCLQKSTGSGPDTFKLAYRIGPSGAFTPIKNSTVTPVRVGNDTYSALAQTYNGFILPAAMNNQNEVYLRVYFDGLTTLGRNGNTSINNIVIRGNMPFEDCTAGCDCVCLGAFVCNRDCCECPTVPDDAELVFSKDAGFYAEAFDLILTTDYPGGIIRYTTDGSDPAPASAAYSSPIRITDRSKGPGGRLADITGISLIDFWGAGLDPREVYTPPSSSILIGNVIKAQVFDSSGKALTGIHTNTYIITDDPARFAGLPVISVSTNQDNYFDRDLGLFRNTIRDGTEHLLELGNWGGVQINYNQRGEDWERPAYMEFFEPVAGQTGQYTKGFGMQMGSRINGGYSRNHAQKSLRFYVSTSRGSGASRLNYDLMGGGGYAIDLTPITSYRRFLVRNYGSDWLTGSMRDQLVHRFSRGLNFPVQDSRNAVMLLNGEFWGLYEIRERFDEHYVQSNYNLSHSNVAIVDGGNGWDYYEDMMLYLDMLRWFSSNRNLSSPERYAEAQRFFDMDNFIDYFIVQTYACDTDWLSGNWRIWRTRGSGYPGLNAPVHPDDGRWRWILCDVDQGFNIYGTDHNTNDFGFLLNHHVSSGVGWNEVIPLFFQAFCTNQEFVTKFINRYFDLMNTHMHPDVIRRVIDEIEAEIRPVMPMNMDRWAVNYSSFENWEHSVSRIKEFNVGRPAAVRNHIVTTPQLGMSVRSSVQLTLQTNPSRGHINLNGMDIRTGTPGVPNPASWSGHYLTGMTQTIAAVPAQGYCFSKFIVNGTGTDANPLTLTMTANTTVSAAFCDCGKDPCEYRPIPPENRGIGFVYMFSADYEPNNNWNAGINHINGPFAEFDVTKDGTHVLTLPPWARDDNMWVVNNAKAMFLNPTNPSSAALPIEVSIAVNGVDRVSGQQLTNGWFWNEVPGTYFGNINLPTRDGFGNAGWTTLIPNYTVTEYSVSDIPNTVAVGSSWAGASDILGPISAGDIITLTYKVGEGSPELQWSDLPGIKQVSAGGGHTLAIKNDGSLWAWGRNNVGQLGLGDSGLENGRHAPTQVGTDTNWASVSAGLSHTVAIKTDGSLWAWGANDQGQLGLGNRTDKTSPQRVGTDTDWASVSAGGSHTIALKTDGSLWAWGDNWWGQLGLGDQTLRTAPERVGTDTDWTSVSAGDYYTMAIKTDRSLWAWGDNTNGQLGLGNRIYMPTQVGTETNWESVSAGGRHTTAIKTDGSLWAWGDNWWGQLGLGNTTHRTTPTQVGTDTNWASVSAGGGHTAAIKKNGSLLAWGVNWDGSREPVPVWVGTDTNWISVSAGGAHIMALKSDGSLWAWGDNWWGQLGDGTTDNRSVPVRIWPYPVKEPSPVLINQVHGAGAPMDGAISHSFIELYNTSERDVDLGGWSIQIANAAGNNQPTGDWQMLPLTGTIKAKSYFLIVFTQFVNDGTAPGNSLRYTIPDGEWDLEWHTELSNRAYTVALVDNQTLFAQPLLSEEDWRSVLSTVSAYNDRETVLNPWGGIPRISKQRAVRRIDFAETGDNSADFEELDYRTSGLTNERLSEVKPRWSKWNVVRGDVDGDGIIDAADITLLRRYIAAEDKDAFRAANPRFNEANADVNGDGFINAADVALLRQYVAGFIVFDGK
jgi:alpha-tubulin suppressor-like RCC1 family protein